MNAIKLLEDQHRMVEQLFKRFEQAGEDHQAKYDLFTEIADQLSAHSTIEEKIFYPSVEDEQTEDLLREAVEEHLGVKRLIADLLDLEPSDEQFDAKVKVLQEQVQHHVREEETDLFVKVRKLFEEESLDEMGIKMENMLADILAEGEPRNEVPNETDRAAPIS